VIGSHVTVNIANKNTDTIKQGGCRPNGRRTTSRSRPAAPISTTLPFRSANTFANNYWQAYSGYGPASGTTGGVAIPTSLYNGMVSTANFIPGYGALPPTLIDFSAIAFQNF
jgi:iron complex outermembrane receptor protein